MPPSRAAALAATLAAAVVWGTSFNVNDIGLAHVDPATFTVLRFAVAAAVALAFAAALKRLDARVLRDPWLWGLALANGLGFLLQYFGQTLTTPARTALFVNASAFFVPALERIFFKLHVGPRRALAIGGGLVGAALLVTGGDPRALTGGRTLGDALVVGAGFLWAVYTILNSRAVRQGDPVNVVAWTFALTALTLTPFLALDEAPLRVPVAGAWPVLYAGLVTTALAFALWAYGLRTLRPSTTTLLLLVEILVASLVSVLILRRETLGVWELAGAAVLGASVLAISAISATETTQPDEAPARRA